MNHATDVTPLPRTDAAHVPAQALSAFLDAVQAAELELHSLMLLQHGHVLAQGWWAPYGPALPHVLYSLSKSFTSTAAGLAIAEGRFSLDDAVVSFFPNDLPAVLSENLRAVHLRDLQAAMRADHFVVGGDNLRAMRVRHLLSMATGHTEEPALWATPPGSNWVRQFLAAPVAKKPGTHFLYNSAATYMVSAIVEQTTGEPLLNYLTPRLLTPLGIEGATWETDPRGIAVGGWGLNITTEAIARFGQLYLQNGVWNGARLLPEGWVENATSKHISNGDNPDNDWNQGYGFQFWRCRHNAYRGDGAFGQFCVVMPEQDAVLAITSNVGSMGTLLNLVWEHLLPALQPTDKTPGDPAAHQKLTERLAGLTIAAPQPGVGSPPLAAQISGAEYRFAENDEKIAAAALRFDGDICLLIFNDTDGKTHTLNGSLSRWEEGTTTFLQSRVWRQVPNPTGKTAMRGAWINDTTLAFKLCFIETPFTPTLLFRFDGDQSLTLEIKGSIGFGSSERRPLAGRRE